MLSVPASAALAAPSYSPRILRNLAEICEAFGVGEKMVKAWVRKGAPIAVEASGSRSRYSAEAASLQFWRLESSGKGHASGAWNRTRPAAS